MDCVARRSAHVITIWLDKTLFKNISNSVLTIHSYSHNILSHVTAPVIVCLHGEFVRVMNPV